VTTKAYFLPQSVDEAINLLAEFGPTLLVMAGGTLAMPLINEGISMPEQVMGLRRTGLNYVNRTDGMVHIGATTTLSQLLAQEEIPLLQQAAFHVGGWAIRNMGTVGGNLFAPPPAGDVAVALLALDARVKLLSRAGERLLPLANFYTGFMMTALAPGELVTEFTVPIPQGKTVYLKYGRRHANTPAVVSLAAHLVLEGQQVCDARLALNAVGPHPMRATGAEQVLVGAVLDTASITQAAAVAAAECQPFTDPVASDWYRRRMVEVNVRRALTQMLG
jgi:CO/xanthine dehydrogenase FAD-binding subunit